MVLLVTGIIIGICAITILGCVIICLVKELQE